MSHHDDDASLVADGCFLKQILARAPLHRHEEHQSDENVHGSSNFCSILDTGKNDLISSHSNDLEAVGKFPKPSDLSKLCFFCQMP